MLSLMKSSNTLLTSDKHSIAFDLYQAGHEKLIIIAHGFFNSKDSLLLLRLKDTLLNDYDVLLFDFRGHGKSSGFFCWLAREDIDLDVVLQFAGRSYKNIGLIGFSFGAATSISVLSKQNSVQTFVAVSAPERFWKINYCFWNLDFEEDIIYNLGEGRIGRGVRPGPFWLKKPKPIELIGKVRCPILFIHGKNDWVTGYKHSIRLYERAAGHKQLHIIEHGSHSEYLMRKTQNEFIEVLKNWLRRTF